MQRRTEREAEIAEKKKLCSANLTIRTPYISQEKKADRRYRSYVNRHRTAKRRKAERELEALLAGLLDDRAAR